MDVLVGPADYECGTFEDAFHKIKSRPLRCERAQNLAGCEDFDVSATLLVEDVLSAMASSSFKLKSVFQPH